MTTSQAATRLVSVALAVVIFGGAAVPSAQGQVESGPRLAFFDGTKLRTVGADGRGQRTIAETKGGPAPETSSNGPSGGPAWSPEGLIAWGHITAVDYMGGVRSELRVARADGSDPTTLTSLPGHIEEIDWSPDGRRLAFVLWVNNPVVRTATWTDLGDRRDIYLINKDGSGLQTIAPVHATAVGGLDFSPDGRSLAFDSDAHGVRSIYTVATDGASVPVRLTPFDLFGYDPRWSPDGSRIAFRGKPVFFDAHPKLWTIDPDGSKPRELAAETYHPPSWSPDGRWLVFAEASGIKVIRADGSATRTLTSAEDFWPTWSRTGRIAFVRDVTPHLCCSRALWVMDGDGSNARQVTASYTVDFPIAWSR